MVNTNVAPQWQMFNSGNWARVEAAVVSYVQKNKRNLYVVTGTGNIHVIMYECGRFLVIFQFLGSADHRR